LLFAETERLLYGDVGLSLYVFVLKFGSLELSIKETLETLVVKEVLGEVLDGLFGCLGKAFIRVFVEKRLEEGF
jgi:hypothetical protein